MNKLINAYQDYIAVFIVLLLYGFIGHLLNAADPFMIYLNPHPFLIASIILSAYFGFQFSIYCSVLFSSFYFLGLHVQADYQAIESIFEAQFLVTPLSLVFLSLIIGEFRERNNEQLNSEKEKLKTEQILNRQIKETINIQKRELEELQTRLVSKTDSIGQLHAMAIGLNELDLPKLLSNFLSVLEEQSEAKVAVVVRYQPEAGLLSPLGYLGDGEKYFKSSRKLEDMQDLIFENCIKSVMLKTVEDQIAFEEAHQTPLDGALIACPIMLEGNCFGVLAIYDIPFLKYVPSNFKLIAMLTDWLGSSIQKSIDFQKISDRSSTDLLFDVTKFKTFEDRMEEELEQSLTYSTPLTILNFKIMGHQNLEDYKKVPIKKSLIKILDEYSKKMDVISLGKDESELFMLLIKDEKTSAELMNKIIADFNEYDFQVKDMSLSLSAKLMVLNATNKTVGDIWSELDAIPYS